MDMIRIQPAHRQYWRKAENPGCSKSKIDVNNTGNRYNRTPELETYHSYGTTLEPIDAQDALFHDYTRYQMGSQIPADNLYASV